MQGRTGAARAPNFTFLSCDCQMSFAKCLFRAKLAPVEPCDAVFGGAFFLPAEGDVQRIQIGIELHFCCSSAAN